MKHRNMALVVGYFARAKASSSTWWQGDSRPKASFCQSSLAVMISRATSASSLPIQKMPAGMVTNSGSR
jgi:hypothetical protein